MDPKIGIFGLFGPSTIILAPGSCWYRTTKIHQNSSKIGQKSSKMDPVFWRFWWPPREVPGTYTPNIRLVLMPSPPGPLKNPSKTPKNDQICPLFGPIFGPPGWPPRGPRGDPHPGYSKILLPGLDVLRTSKIIYRELWHAKMSNMYTSTRSSQKSNLGIKNGSLPLSRCGHFFEGFFGPWKNT